MAGVPSSVGEGGSSGLSFAGADSFSSPRPARCSSRFATELQIAASRCMLHPYTECSAYPCMTVSMINLIVRTIMNIASTPALADPNVMNPFHNRSPADSAILLRDSSSSRLIMEILPAGMFPPIAPLASVFSMDGFSTGNIICVLNLGLHLCKFRWLLMMMDSSISTLNVLMAG